MNWTAKIYTEPTVEPVSVADFKTHARISTNLDDAYIATLLKAARMYCEKYTRRQFVEATWKLYIDAMPSSGQSIELPYPPLLSVTTFQYVDTDYVTQTWSSTEYDVDTSATFGRLYEDPDYVWPTAATVRNCVTITYKAGYGTTASSVPEPIRMAIMLLAAHWYENREAMLTGNTSEVINFGLQNLLSMYTLEGPDL